MACSMFFDFLHSDYFTGLCHKLSASYYLSDPSSKFCSCIGDWEHRQMTEQGSMVELHYSTRCKKCSIPTRMWTKSLQEAISFLNCCRHTNSFYNKISLLCGLCKWQAKSFHFLCCSIDRNTCHQA